MLKKGHDLKWSDEAKRDFLDIKHAFCHSLVLSSPNYCRDFQLFSFVSDFTMAIVLLQKNIEGMEQPIAFMSKAFQGLKFNYELMENKLMRW